VVRSACDGTNHQPKDKVAVRLENGYNSTGVVIRLYKNGRIGVREANGKYYVRYARAVTLVN